MQSRSANRKERSRQLLCHVPFMIEKNIWEGVQKATDGAKTLQQKAHLQQRLYNKMFSLTTLAVVASGAVTQVAAHGGVLSYSWAGQWYWGWQPYNRYDYYMLSF